MTDYVLEGILKLDSSEFERGLKGAKSLASGVMEGLTVAIGAATTAMGAFAVSAVNTGQQFDKSMSQVAATMGKTTEEIGDLREFAQEMGRTTAFSATEAADALNYMALAGYDAQTSMEMLPNVLNLAAAGNMDLARASDMVTDTQTAFGISLERTTQMVDEMAKAASTGNTSVEQLGDAFLTVGGLAQELNGGMITLEDGTTRTYDNVQELEIALTAMANAGIKGSEAGTHMRNMLLKLSSPTDAGVKQLQALGVSVFDTEGNMRSLAAIMEDLGGAMDNLTQEQKLQAISDLFNTRDTAAAEALLKAVDEDWTDIAESILDADGAAQKMADTQLDNLAGDVTLFKSALEGAQIAVSDGITPKLREFVQLGTKGLSEVTDAFQKDGLDGAIKAFGDILSEGITLILSKAPEMVRAGVKLLSAFAKGLAQNRKQVAQAVKEIFAVITGTLAEEFPQIKPILDALQGSISTVFGFIEDHGAGVAVALKSILATLIAFKTATAVMSGVSTAVSGVSTAITFLASPVGIATVAFGALVAAMLAFSARTDAVRAAAQAERDAFVSLTEDQQKAVDAAHAFHDSMNELRGSNSDVIADIDLQYQAEAALISELQGIVDANGQVKAGYEERAQVITGQLAEAFGIEIDMQNGVILKYDEVMAKLDQVIEKKKAEALISANSGKYAELMGQQVEQYGQVVTAEKDYQAALEERDAVYARLKAAQDEMAQKQEEGYLLGGADYDKIAELKEELSQAQDKMLNLKKANEEVSSSFEEGQAFITNYENLVKAAETDSENLGSAVTQLAHNIIHDAPVEKLQQQYDEAFARYQEVINALSSGDTHVTEEMKNEAYNMMSEAYDALAEGKSKMTENGHDAVAGYVEGLQQTDEVAGAAGTMVEEAIESVKTAQDSHSPSKVFELEGINAILGYKQGIENRFPEVLSVVRKGVDNVKKIFTDIISNALTWGSDLIGNFVSGIQAKWGDLTTAVAGAAQVVADNLGFSEPKEGPLSDFHTYAPDMMKLFAEGIKDNAYLVRDQMAESLSMETVTQNVTPPNNSEIISLLQQIRDEGRVQVTLEGDADRLFRAMQRKATANYRLTGNPGMVTE